MDKDLFRRHKADPFEPYASLVHYSARDMEVDGVFRRAINDPHRSEIISIKKDDDRFFDPAAYVYEHDQWPIDEVHYLKVGCIRSTDPDKIKKTTADNDEPYSRMTCWCEALEKAYGDNPPE